MSIITKLFSLTFSQYIYIFNLLSISLPHDRMLELLSNQPQLQEAYQAELSERSEVIIKYLRLLQP